MISVDPGGRGVTPLYGLHWCAAGQGMVFYLHPPPLPLPSSLGADMLEMTTDAQEGNNKTSQGLINTMQSHSVVKPFEITMIFYWFSFIYGLKSPPLQVIMHQRQPWKLFYLQVIKKTFIFKGPMSIHSTPSMTDTIGTVTMCLS